MLISVPGGNDGPGGVLVCAEKYIIYKNFGDQPDIRVPIPRRRVSNLHLTTSSASFNFRMILTLNEESLSFPVQLIKVKRASSFFYKLNKEIFSNRLKTLGV